MKEFFAYCANRVRETDRDRYLATLFAPADKRNALFALYAFDIEISRVRELARETMPGEIRLQWWREVLLGERAGEATANPVGAAVMDILGRFAFARDPLVDLVEARRFDVHNEPMVSAEEFESYASRPRRSPMCSPGFRNTPRDVSSMFPLTVFGVIQPSRKTFLRCARHRNCVPRSLNCAYARVVVSLMSPRPRFPRPYSRFFCHWHHSGVGF